MHRVPLKEYKMPRILAVDFTEKEVKKISETGFNTKRAYSGLYDNNEYCIPSALQDIEIALIKCSGKTFINFDERKKSKESVLEKFTIHSLIREIWGKGGWSLIFMNDDMFPEQLEQLGIENIGLGEDYGRYISASNQLVRNGRIMLKFPKFIGETVVIEEDNPGNLLMKFFKSGKWMLLAMEEQGVELWGQEVSRKWIIKDDSSSPLALAIMLYHLFSVPPDKTYLYTACGEKIKVELPKHLTGGIIILPDFGIKNVDVGLSLVYEFIHEINPLLFSEPLHEWLSDYRPAPVKQLYKKREDIEAKMKKEIEDIDKKIEKEEGKYLWLDMLLVGVDEDFIDSVGIALSFLGFKVKDVDKGLSPIERKCEDFNITDPHDNSFFIAEAKATKRGASEGFITKTQNHQGSYSRRNKRPIPDAILIVNHSFDLNPNQRSGRFYTDADVLARLKEQNIKAIDSISLHSLCQKVLAGELNEKKAREFIKKISGAISSNIKI